MAEIPSSDNVSTKLERIAKLAKESPQMAFTSLSHYIDIDWLREAYRRTRKDGALGVDGQTATEYAMNLESHLESLLNRAKSGTYRAPPVRRVHIPKGDGSKTRPIGIPTFEDKVLQRAVAMVLEAIYEQDFMDCSYGFRPRRSAHQMLREMWRCVMNMEGGWVLEVDITNYFGTINHAQLLTILRRRVRDGVLLRLIGKWLNAGVMEAGYTTYPITGTPQGGVISPILSNVYLHEVLDEWYENTVRSRLKGQSGLYRYADDFVIVFSREDDARRVLDVLPKRFEKYGLSLHPEKTRLVEFKRPDRREHFDGKSGTFDLLGFTHFWRKSRKGHWVIFQHTAKDRFRRALKRISEWCQRYLHAPVKWQRDVLERKLVGHYRYYGHFGDRSHPARFRFRVIGIWRKWLDRRSQKARMSWERMKALLERYPLPDVHDVMTRRIA